MKNDFEAIKAAASEPQWVRYGPAWVNSHLSLRFGLPMAKIIAGHPSDERAAWEARFIVNSENVTSIPPATGRTRAEAAARLICEARRYLEREKNAETVIA